MSVDIDRVLTNTTELVSIPSTVSNVKAQVECLEYVVQQLPNWLDATWYKNNNQSSVVVSTEDTLYPDTLLHGHVDVVDAADDNFEPEMSGDRLYGRGTGDMKAGIACLIEVLQQFGPSSEIPSVALMLVTDEEAGGYDGVQYLVEEIGYEPEFAISAEPNNTGKTLPIVTRQKGIVGVRIYAEGESCHAAEPWEGKNAAHKLFEEQSEVLSLFEEPDPEEWKTTGVVTELDATGYANVVPEEASMLINVRYTQSITSKAHEPFQ
jgi:succinyl-diaminopimelate desuccinylase